MEIAIRPGRGPGIARSVIGLEWQLPMFTGIVQHLGEVVSLESNDFGAVLRIDADNWSHNPTRGDSIAINGCCLTLAGDSDGGMCFDVIRQTLEITTLGGLAQGDPVNLEHAVTPSTMLGGHIVQGHIDGVGIVDEVTKETSEWRMRIRPPEELLLYMVKKGSIALDGTSLTIARMGDDFLEVALIPTTLKLTTLGRLEPGDRVNLETDYIAKTVVNWLERTRNSGT